MAHSKAWTRHASRLFRSTLGRSHRRQAKHISRIQTGVCLGPSLVDTHFTAANDAIDMGFWHALEVAHQEIVQPLASGVRVYSERMHLCQRRGSFDPYNVFH
jgi:hypothetical protein